MLMEYLDEEEISFLVGQCVAKLLLVYCGSHSTYTVL